MAKSRLIEPEYCSICGRGMLRGETTRAYVTDRGERVGVCALCKDRAAASGWVPADRATRLPDGAAGRTRGRRVALRERISAGTSRSGTESDSTVRLPRSRRRRSAGEGGESPQQLSRERRVRDAIIAFNGSGHERTIAGLARSLGTPRASAVPVGREGEVRITVAWDLAWYQWQTKPQADGEIRVREYKKGSELGQLSPHDRAWNVHVGDDGSLRVVPRGGDDGQG